MSDPRGSTREGDTFLDRLGELVLLSFATGQTVEGSWFFVNSHRMVPDMTVAIVRTDDGRNTLSGDGTVSGTDPREFDRKLESFLLAEFALGERIVGTWELRYDREELPSWDVSIELGDVEFEGELDGFPLRTPGEG